MITPLIAALTSHQEPLKAWTHFLFACYSLPSYVAFRLLLVKWLFYAAFVVLPHYRPKSMQAGVVASVTCPVALNWPVTESIRKVTIVLLS